jgi:glutathione S-transferase
MAITLYYGSGSPYAWRVWLALEHKGIPYELRTLSFDAGDLGKPEFRALNPRGRVPVLVDDGFALAESAAIVEYLEDKRPGEPRLFAAEPRQRAVQRRMVREADEYLAAAMEALARAVLFTPPEQRVAERVAACGDELRQELARWETAIGGDYLAGALSAADLTVYPMVALVQRMASRNPGVIAADLIGPKMSAWADRMAALPATKKTWPPHWR